MAGKTILVLMMLLGFISPANDPFSGTWILNRYAAKIPPPFSATKSLIVHVTVNTSDIEITEEVIRDSGEHSTIHAKAKFDGKDYPITGTSYANTVAYERVDRNIISGIVKKDGVLIMQVNAVLSPEGKGIVGY